MVSVDRAGQYNFLRSLVDSAEAWQELRAIVIELVHAAEVKVVAARLGRDPDLLSNMLADRRALPAKDLLVIAFEFDPAKRILGWLCEEFECEPPTPKHSMTDAEWRARGEAILDGLGETGKSIRTQIEVRR